MIPNTEYRATPPYFTLVFSPRTPLEIGLIRPRDETHRTYAPGLPDPLLGTSLGTLEKLLNCQHELDVNLQLQPCFKNYRVPKGMTSCNPFTRLNQLIPPDNIFYCSDISRVNTGDARGVEFGHSSVQCPTSPAVRRSLTATRNMNGARMQSRPEEVAVVSRQTRPELTITNSAPNPVLFKALFRYTLWQKTTTITKKTRRRQQKYSHTSY